jgi:hypothetical protein
VETDNRLTEKLGMQSTLERMNSSENLTMPENLAITLLPLGNLTLTGVISL